MDTPQANTSNEAPLTAPDPTMIPHALKETERKPEIKPGLSVGKDGLYYLAPGLPPMPASIAKGFLNTEASGLGSPSTTTATTSTITPPTVDSHLPALVIPTRTSVVSAYAPAVLNRRTEPPTEDYIPESLNALAADFRNFRDATAKADVFVDFILERIDRQHWGTKQDLMPEAFECVLAYYEGAVLKKLSDGKRKQLLARTRNWMAALMKQDKELNVMPALKVLLRIDTTAEEASLSKLPAVLRILSKNSNQKIAVAAVSVAKRFNLSTDDKRSSSSSSSSASATSASASASSSASSSTAAKSDASTSKSDEPKPKEKPERASILTLAAQRSTQKKPTVPVTTHAKLFEMKPKPKADSEPVKPADAPTETTETKPEKPAEVKRHIMFSELKSLNAHKRARPSTNDEPEPLKPAKSAKKKKVHWKPDADLVEVRTFEVENLNSRTAMDGLRDFEHDEGAATKSTFKYIDWYSPPRLDLSKADFGQMVDQMGISRGGKKIPESPENVARMAIEAKIPIDLSSQSPTEPEEPEIAEIEAMNGPAPEPKQMPAFVGAAAPPGKVQPRVQGMPMMPAMGMPGMPMMPGMPGMPMMPGMGMPMPGMGMGMPGMPGMPMMPGMGYPMGMNMNMNMNMNYTNQSSNK